TAVIASPYPAKNSHCRSRANVTSTATTATSRSHHHPRRTCPVSPRVRHPVPTLWDGDRLAHSGGRTRGAGGSAPDDDRHRLSLGRAPGGVVGVPEVIDGDGVRHEPGRVLFALGDR